MNCWGDLIPEKWSKHKVVFQAFWSLALEAYNPESHLTVLTINCRAKS